MKPPGLALFLCLVLAVTTLQARAEPTEEIVQLHSEGDAIVPYLLGWDDNRTPAAVAVLFTGGPGVINLLNKGIPHPGGNFLLRSRRFFLDQGIATAAIDAPSDMRALPDTYRMSARQARDVASVISDVKARFPGAHIFLVGTSRGTVSAAYSAASLGAAISGVVLTSTVFRASKGGGGLSDFDYRSIQSPLLFVHHVDDSCTVTPYASARTLGQTYPLISVSGGDPARSDPCEAFSAHGYLGVEAATVSAMSKWMLGLEYPKTVP
jgi:hypothetical protein